MFQLKIHIYIQIDNDITTSCMLFKKQFYTYIFAFGNDVQFYATIVAHGVGSHCRTKHLFNYT